MPLPVVALVGTPNVGKSTLFNRLVGYRASIVDDVPGITRDRIYGKVTWLTKEFRLIDTGGIEVNKGPFQDDIRVQVEIAIEEADLILFVVDGKSGLKSDDYEVAKMLYKSNKRILLVVNKIDNIDLVGDAVEFYSLGLGDPWIISSSHGIGVGDLLDEIVANLKFQEEQEYPEAVTFCLIGRPNVGKSSLTNSLLGQERVIVNSIAGTTRDSIDTPFDVNDKHFVCIDTAGLVKRGKIYESIDKYAAIRALSAIERSQIALVVLDASTGILDQDRHVAGYAFEEKKGMVIVVNKWDLAKKGLSQEEFSAEIRDRFKFLAFAEIVYVSAKTGKGVNKIIPAILRAYESINKRVPTSILNQIILDAQNMNPTPNFNHGRLKIMFSSQVSVNPPTFVMFCNDPNFAHFSYTRYLENRIRNSFDFTGTPINIIYRLAK
ncbi:MAG: ribosome biogenesis GTPase Der [Bacilli bacterium]|nr:ribosome biogenesis GTPase Der [Bacilli bacterium]